MSSYLIQTPLASEDSGAIFTSWAQDSRACTEVKSPRIENRSEKTEFYYLTAVEFFLVDSIEEGDISIYYFILETLSRNKTFNQEAENKMRE